MNDDLFAEGTPIRKAVLGADYVAASTGGAPRNDCTRDEIREVLLQAAVYCGLPAAIDAFRLARMSSPKPITRKAQAMPGAEASRRKTCRTRQ